MDKKISKTKQKIINKALDLFASNGYKNSSIRMISSAVGIRESAVYNHFKNKEGILSQIIDTYFYPTFSIATQDHFKNIYEDQNPKSFLQEFAISFKLLAYQPGSDKFFRFLIIELMQNTQIRDLFINKYIKIQLNSLSNAFFAMMQKNLIKSQDPILLAYEFISSLFFYRMQISILNIDNKEESKTLSSMFEKHVNLFWENIRK